MFLLLSVCKLAAILKILLFELGYTKPLKILISRVIPNQALKNSVNFHLHDNFQCSLFNQIPNHNPDVSICSVWIALFILFIFITVQYNFVYKQIYK